MARRMFSPTIVNSDAFIEMAPSTQALYFQLGMRADDDGFVNPKMVMRMMGSNDDELKMLFVKRFILPFENGVVVIKHWRVNNLVRKDWYKETIYTEEKSMLFVKENGSYTLDETKGIPLVNEMLTNRSRRLGKVRLGNTTEQSSEESEPLKDNKEDMAWKQYNENKNSDDGLEEVQTDPDYKPVKKEKKKVSDEVQQVFDLFSNPAKGTWYLRPLERESAKILFTTYGMEVLQRRMELIKRESKNKDNTFFPLITSPSTLLEKMPNVEHFLGK